MHFNVLNRIIPYLVDLSLIHILFMGFPLLKFIRSSSGVRCKPPCCITGVLRGKFNVTIGATKDNGIINLNVRLVHETAKFTY